MADFGWRGPIKRRWLWRQVFAAARRRVIYANLDETMPLYALLAYAKNAKTDMTPDEKRAVSALVVALKATRKEMK